MLAGVLMHSSEMAMVAGSRWTPDAIMEAARRAASILAQCEIRVTRLRLHEFDGPERYRYLSTPDSREFAQRAALAKPAVFFVDDTRQQLAFDAEAVGRGNAGYGVFGVLYSTSFWSGFQMVS